LAIRLFRSLPHANRCVTSISPWTGAHSPPHRSKSGSPNSRNCQ
jgi:hypothetical protein